ncbi:MAG: hypothetical protein ABI383_08160 [Acidobacteriaceae bacterium]
MSGDGFEMMTYWAGSSNMEEQFTRTLTRGSDKLLRILVWSSVGVSVVAAALYAGYEIRLRRLIKRRSPYELFGHAGDDPTWIDDTEYGVGI